MTKRKQLTRPKINRQALNRSIPQQCTKQRHIALMVERVSRDEEIFQRRGQGNRFASSFKRLFVDFERERERERESTKL